MRVPCHKKISALDIRMVRKADRQRKAFLGLKKPKGRNLQGKAFGPSRGFDRTLRRKMSGRVEVRT